jgi:hypothetical protein
MRSSRARVRRAPAPRAGVEGLSRQVQDVIEGDQHGLLVLSVHGVQEGIDETREGVSPLITCLERGGLRNAPGGHPWRG